MSAAAHRAHAAPLHHHPVVPEGPGPTAAAGLATHLDVLPDPSFLLDAMGRISLANRAAHKALGSHGPAIAPGATFLSLWDAGVHPIAQATLGIAAREVARFDAQLAGSPAAFDVALSPTGDGTILAVCRDVTGLAPATAAPATPAPAVPAPAVAEPAPEPSGEPIDATDSGPPVIAEETFQEIDHRLRNLFAMVPALVKLSMRKGGDVSAVHKAITGRVAALSRANSLSLQQASRSQGVSIDDLIAVVLDRGAQDERIVSSGPPVRLATRAYNAVALTLHELTTNALAHGALSNPEEGRLRIAWAIEDEARGRPLPEDATGCLRLLWTESGGPRIDDSPRPRGFGTSTVDKLIGSQNGTIEREWLRHGLHVTIDLPLYDLGAEPKYAKPLQPPPLPKVAPQVARARPGATASTAPGEIVMAEHVAPRDAEAEREAVLEAEIVNQLDRIIAHTRH